MRFSRAAGFPAPVPDVLGLALRLGAVGTQHDLLLATTGMRPGWRHVLVPRRHALRAPYGSLLPYDAAGRRVLIAAVPEAGAPYGISDADVARALAPASRTFQLMVATLLGNWTPLAQLTVTRDDNMLDVPVAFDPILNPLPGLPSGNRSVLYENRRTVPPGERGERGETRLAESGALPDDGRAVNATVTRRHHTGTRMVTTAMSSRGLSAWNASTSLRTVLVNPSAESTKRAAAVASLSSP